MVAELIDGKAIALKIRKEIKQRVDSMDTKPGLAVVRVGEDPASVVYVNMKEKACQKAGFYSEKHTLAEETSEEELLAVVDKLNNDPKIHGFLVQLPLPPHIDEKKVLDAIDPKKDVDGFHAINMGKLLSGDKQLVPATPAGVLKMLDEIGVDPKGKHAVIVGRSNIVGKPVSILLLERHATVTICHSRTTDIVEECKRADILVAAVGRPKMVTGEMIKEGAVVIDVGVNRVDDASKEKGYYLCGDVDFDAAKEKASFITPVPGGVGPMTIAMLLSNTLDAKEIQEKGE